MAETTKTKMSIVGIAALAVLAIVLNATVQQPVEAATICRDYKGSVVCYRP